MIDWTRTDNDGVMGMSYAEYPNVSFEVSEYVSHRGKWAAHVDVKGTVLRAGYRLPDAFLSREAAEVVATTLLLKHIEGLAAIIGYKVVKDEEGKQ